MVTPRSSSRQPQYREVFPTPGVAYDRESESQFRALVERRLSQAASPSVAGVRWYDIADYAGSLQGAVNAAETAGGGVVFVSSGEWELTEDVTCPREVQIWGAGSLASKIFAAVGSQYDIIVEGQGGWMHLISGLHLNRVGVRYGNTVLDFANGATIRDCEFENADKGVEYIRNSWQTLIDNCRFYTCTHGVYFDYATAASGSGSVQKISNSGIFNSDYGVYVNGITSDGCSIIISGTDIENCFVRGIYASGLGDGVLMFTDGHFEFSGGMPYAIDVTGGNVQVNNIWCFAAGPTSHTALFRIGAGARLWLAHARLQWDVGQLFDLQGGFAIIDSDSIFANGGFFGAGAQVMCTASSSSGYILNGGGAYPLGERWGKVSTGRVGATAPITAVGGAVTSIGVLQAREISPRTFQFTLNISAAGSGSQLLRVEVVDGAGGGGYTDLSLPVATGNGELWVTWVPGSTIRVHGYFVDMTTNAAHAFDQGVSDTAGLGRVRYMNLAHIVGGGSPTWTYRNLREDVH